jgi:hydrogenase nickel incorporation protein HypB
MSEVVLLQQSVMAADEKHALSIRMSLKRKGILFVNIIGSPGCGKTTLLEETAKRGKLRMAVIEGDIETSRDAERLAKLGVNTYQINTHGGCHLVAHVVERVIGEMSLDDVDVLFVENVGNLVCPAEFDLGEDFKVAVLSTPEGADKPLKYPMLFANSHAIVLTKTDLLPHVRFNMQMFKDDISSINPVVPVVEIDLINGNGMDAWLEFIAKKLEEKKSIGSIL